MIWKIVCCMIGGYAFGCFSTAYIVGKKNNIDIRNYGSGNAGTTNALRTLGKKAGAITFLGDLLKAIIPVLLVKFVIFTGTEDVELLALYTGLGVVLGHNYPFWLKFKGGKGVAVTTGVFYGLEPIGSIFGTLVFLATVLITKYVSLASILSVFFTCIWLIVRHEAQPHYVVIISLYALLTLWRHRDNMKRLRNGTENKINQNKKPLIAEERAEK